MAPDRDYPEKATVYGSPTQWSQILQELGFTRRENSEYLATDELADVSLDDVEQMIRRINLNELPETGGELTVNKQEMRTLWQAHSDFRFDYLQEELQTPSQQKIKSNVRDIMGRHQRATGALIGAEEDSAPICA